VAPVFGRRDAVPFLHKDILMSKRREFILSLIMTGCAITVASVYVYTQLFAGPRLASATLAPPDFVKDWRSYSAGALHVGDTDGKIKIIEFSDFECPYCALFDDRLDTLMHEFPGQVAVSFIHFPLSTHKQAMPAALAAECASEQSRFAEMASELFRAQDSLGLQSWATFGLRAGISDTVRLNRCIADPRTAAKVSAAQKKGQKLGVTGTPTVLVNGWRYTYAPPIDTLRRLLRDVVANRPLFSK
jgi:predicted DsbA family dithiol-disulfide isomerase